jgi:uncharacterized repeat protein (TIGR04138 family)
MKTASDSSRSELQFHPAAYDFVFAALGYTQELLGRGSQSRGGDEEAHISGEELLEGIRRLALKQFGLLTRTVFKQWGIRETADFGRIVFELIDRGEMRKNDRDQIGDFANVYSFQDAFDEAYSIDVSRAFK